MEKKEVRKLNLGLYVIYWKDGGNSLAAVGQTENGDKWLAPINWIFPSDTYKKSWLRVKSVTLIGCGE